MKAPNTEQKDHINFSTQVQEILRSKHGPPAVIVNDSLNILSFSGNTTNYLQQKPGNPTLNIFQLVQQSLATELRNVFNQSKKKKNSSVSKLIPILIDKKIKHIKIESIPITHDGRTNYLILFIELNQVNSKQIKNSNGIEKQIKPGLIQKLKQELIATHKNITDQKIATAKAYAELQTANEELITSSEELQSLNEEIETQKEELQNTNDTLTTTNQEISNLNKQLSEANDYALAIIGTLHEPMLVLNKDLVVKSANKSYYEVFHVNQEETEGELFFNLIDKKWNIKGLSDLVTSIIPENQYIQNFEVAATFPKIGKKNFLLNANPLFQKAPFEPLILIAIHDVTEIKNNALQIQLQEKKLLKLALTKNLQHNKKLEIAVKSRTTALEKANHKFEEKNSELEKTNKELEAFAYISSHDLQEPLRKIQMFTGRILEKENENLSVSGKDYFNRMQAAADRKQMLINDILNFSRINVIERKYTTIDMNEVIQRVQSELKELIDEKNAIINSFSTCKATVISFQIHQLMYNLISNALKFTDPGIAPKIIIKCKIIKGEILKFKKLKPETKYLHFSIEDHGIGFDPRYNEAIFVVFKKLHTQEFYKGTGIGLAIVKKIVDNHKGFITANGILNKGAKFDIYLPQ